MSSVWAELRRRAGVLTRADWTWSPSDTDANIGRWSSLPKRSRSLEPGEEQRLLLQTSGYLERGWYLFGIRHRGDNRRSTGWLQAGSRHWRQGRPMYPIRRRWRVVRLRERAKLKLELQRVVQPMQLEELWLFRLPSGEAWRRIRRRLRPHLQGHLPSRPEALWRQYNQLLAAQARRHSLIPYERWQRLVEKPTVASLAPLSTQERESFHQHRWGSPAMLVPADHWVVALRNDAVLYGWALPAITAALRLAPKARLLYGDEDQRSSEGERLCPQFKPAWNRELCWRDPYYSSCGDCQLGLRNL